MPLETMKCQECGSADVTEFKPGTYVCGHCEVVFKYVDPCAVKASPTFCACGNQIQFRCQICRTALLCAHCDYRQAGYYQDSTDVGFGYIFDGPVEGIAAGAPVLYDRKLLATLEAIHGGFEHLCGQCLLDAMDATADRIANGVVCEAPTCVNLSNDRCRCCGSSLCTRDLSPSEVYEFRYDLGFDVGATWNASGFGYAVKWPTPLCVPCVLSFQND